MVDKNYLNDIISKLAKTKSMDKELGLKLEKIDQQFQNLMAFLHQNMVTKEEFNEFKQETLGKFQKLENAVNNLTTAVGELATTIKDIAQEHAAMKHQIMVMQDWIRKAADKVGIEFKL